MLSKALNLNYEFLIGDKQYDNNDFKINLIDLEKKEKDIIS